MSQYEEKIEYILVNGHYLEKEEFDKARKEAEDLDVDLSKYLIDHGYITGDILGQAIAEAYKVTYADLNSNVPVKDQVLRVPENIAKEFRAVLFEDREKEIIITTDLPNQDKLRKTLENIFPGKKITITLSLTEDINKILLFYEKSLKERIGHFLEQKDNVASNILNEIFKEAIINNASDIHLEPRENSVRIRFRIDGVLQDKAILPRENLENIINRIKVLSHLRIDEHNIAQDGSIRYELDGQYVDLRISIVPTLYGEKIVARVLTLYIKGLSLEELGLAKDGMNILIEASKKPFGMIINVGPTGSGKTTTLYAMMRILNKSDVNITTIEDPVEYRVENTNQIQVAPQKNLTFAKGLRSIVRQDPDIILVGEIRDEETAEIAVNAALTGHLLLSTFHANDSATAIPRLLDMGIEPFLLASTLELIIAQRLVRKICESCRYSVSSNHELFEGEKITIYQGKGCSMCQNTGYDGRTAIFEYIKMTPELRELILKNPSSAEIWALATRQGSKPLFKDGLDKVKQGITTIEELLRVAKPPENEKRTIKRKTKK